MSNKSVAIIPLVLLTLGCSTSCNRTTPQTTTQQSVAVAAEKGARAPAPRGESSGVPSDDINPPPNEIPAMGTKLELSEEEWQERLTAAQFRVLRKKGTEMPGSGAYNKFYEPGTYHCSACNNPLFSSDTKFDSKTGWPSFYAPIEAGRVGEVSDESHGMQRTEVVCNHCGGHLGHVFTDGPEPTGLRYCINSVSLYYRPSEPDPEAPEPPTEE